MHTSMCLFLYYYLIFNRNNNNAIKWWILLYGEVEERPRTVIKQLMIQSVFLVEVQDLSFGQLGKVSEIWYIYALMHVLQL